MISIHVHVCHMVSLFSYIHVYSREVNSLLILVTTPNHLNSDHNPSHCMDQLMYIAERSKYRKLLSWEPLFDLDTLSTEPIGCLEYHSGEDVGMKFSFHYYGPKVITVCCLSVKLFLYLSIYLSITCIYLSIYLSIFICISVCMSACICISICLFIHLSIYLHVHVPALYLSIYLSIYMYLSIYLSIYMYLFLYLSILSGDETHDVISHS